MRIFSHGNDRRHHNHEGGAHRVCIIAVSHFGNILGIGTQSGGQMASRRTSHDADAGGVNIPFGGTGTNNLHGPLGILDGSFVSFQKIAGPREAAHQHKSIYTQGVEPFGQLIGGLIGVVAVSSGRADNDGRTLVLGRGWPEKFQTGGAHLPHPEVNDAVLQYQASRVGHIAVPKRHRLLSINGEHYQSPQNNQ